MKHPSWIAPLFFLAAAYDGILGAAFLVAHQRLFSAMNIPEPNHPAYIQFPAALLIVFAIGFLMVALRPRARRDIIVLGVLLKVSYAGVVLGHWLLGSIPVTWTYFAWADLAFLVAFVAALAALRAPAGRRT